MNTLRKLAAVVGVGYLLIGMAAAMSGGGATQHVIALGQTLVLAGAILLAGVLISSAIASGGGGR